MALMTDRPHAVAKASHRIAAHVHFMLAERGMTADELKEKLGHFPPPITSEAIVDAVLTATLPEAVTCRALSDIAFALGCEWRFEVARIPEEPVEPQSADND